MRGDQEALPRISLDEHPFANLSNRGGVQAIENLVEKVVQGIMDACDGEGEPLPLAERKSTEYAVSQRLNSPDPKLSIGALSRIQTGYAGIVPDKSANRGTIVMDRSLGDPTDVARRARLLLRDAVAFHKDITGRSQCHP